MRTIENLIAIDLEMNQPSNKIIEIGVCVFNIHNHQYLERKNWYIKIDEPVSEYITNLTGISDETLNTSGVDLLQAYEELTALCKKHNTFINPVTWGGGDTVLLQEQFYAYLDSLGVLPHERPQWIFGRRWIDLKTIWVFHRMTKGEQIQGGLAKTLTKCGLVFKGKKHSAIDDAYNTAVMAHYLKGLMGAK